MREAGLDEAGRGCLAGPVYAAAVVLPTRFYLPGLNDSKLLKPAQRIALAEQIQNQALCWAIGIATPPEIDAINILQASFLAMHRAVEQLDPVPGHLLVDGNRFRPYPSLPHTTIVRGDSLYAAIAAASILAKTARDKYMISLQEQYPSFSFATHKGYGTAAHLSELRQYGPCIAHRLTFRWPGRE